MQWLDHRRCRHFVLHLKRSLWYNPAFSEFPLTRTHWSEIRFHCPRLYSFLSCKRAVLQVTGLCMGPPTQAQSTVRVPDRPAPLQPPSSACSALEVWGEKTWIRTLQNTLASYLVPPFQLQISQYFSAPLFLMCSKAFQVRMGYSAPLKNSLIVYSLLWKIGTEWLKNVK